MFFIFSSSAIAQQMVQVKAFNMELQPYGNIKISINGGENVLLDDKGTAFIDLSPNQIPVRSIIIENQSLEAASWKLSKGILEIVVRKKNYRVVPVLIKNTRGSPLNDVEVTFNGQKVFTSTTDKDGIVNLPLALDEKIEGINQFAINGYQANNITPSDRKYIITADKIAITLTNSEQQKNSKPQSLDQDYFRNFDLKNLDSIQSLTVFYSIFKNFEMEELSKEDIKRIDAKFESLVGELEDAVSKRSAVTVMNNISDTTYLQDDIQNLQKQARLESDLLVQQRKEFEDKIAIVNAKLEQGFDNLNKEQRAELLNDINQLEQLLIANESQFYKNQSSYQQIINSLREQFFDFEELEGKLSGSEAERLREKELFRKRILAILAVVLLFTILIILLIYFSLRLKKQKKDLALANIEVQNMNDNLETIVHDRTRLLEQTFAELDTVLYRASHDLRAPVCSIAGLCNIATITSFEPNEVIDRMVLTNNDMDKLLKKLSIISEIHQPGNFSKVDLSSIINKVVNTFQPVIKENKINLEIDCPQDLIVNTIPNLLEIILYNLLENAVYYCLIKPNTDYSIKLKAYISEEKLVITVFDNGIGVDESIRNQLFEMFFRGTEFSKGNGLGLYIVNKAVRSLNGKVIVESEPGKFSRFIVQLPLEASQEYAFNFLGNNHSEYFYR
ncbi:hypothetical protein GCM10011506_20550 [Marivirga lumbricoides]|uniref:histidine kinase n=2 Tax=Marivirga lumbricoides TaxID=1046115 RepID=A0ABQ1M8K7_9BACT|nr:hypothetical protein GCM10011506_20550 [Marivirga lumbricoides]